MTDNDTERILNEARELGRVAGENAADWWQQDAIGGRVTDGSETARRILRGMDEGDPMIWDSLPNPNLSGEWADDPTPRTLAADLGIDDEAPLLDEACEEWENAAQEAVSDKVERYCREMVMAARVEAQAASRAPGNVPQ